MSIKATETSLLLVATTSSARPLDDACILAAIAKRRRGELTLGSKGLVRGSSGGLWELTMFI